MNNIELDHPKIVSEDKWLVARKAHLEREKALTHLRDQVSAERRELPWVKIEKNYVFDTPNGKETLADLFDGRSRQYGSLKFGHRAAGSVKLSLKLSRPPSKKATSCSPMPSATS